MNKIKEAEEFNRILQLKTKSMKEEHLEEVRKLRTINDYLQLEKSGLKKWPVKCNQLEKQLKSVKKQLQDQKRVNERLEEQKIKNSNLKGTIKKL